MPDSTAVDPAQVLVGESRRRELMAELDLADSQSIQYFGSKAQRALARITERMMKLATGRGPSQASADLDEMLSVLRAFQPDSGSGLLARLFGSRRRRLLRDVAQIVNRIDAAASGLERRKTELLTEVISYDRMIEQAKAALTEVIHYEQVARHALAELTQGSSQPPAAEAADLLARCEDLSMGHVLAQQTLATLLVAQQASQQLLSRVGAVLDQTLPAWQLHMSQLVSLWRGDQISIELGQLGDLHGQMDDMQSKLAEARKEVSTELSSGRRDADALTLANDALASVLGEGRALARTAADAVTKLKPPGA
ncbi:MAG: toxic anion resistance protein [Lysobacterales bacterium]